MTFSSKDLLRLSIRNGRVLFSLQRDIVLLGVVMDVGRFGNKENPIFSGILFVVWALIISKNPEFLS
jgi:hypothetical protein